MLAERVRPLPAGCTGTSAQASRRQINHPQQVMPTVWAASSIASNVHRTSSRRRALRRLLSSLQGEGMKVLKVMALVLAAARSVDRPEKTWPLRPAALRISAIVELAISCALLTIPSVVLQALIGSPSDQAGWIWGLCSAVGCSPSVSPACSHPVSRPGVRGPAVAR